MDFVFNPDRGMEIHTECMSREFVEHLYAFLDKKLKSNELVIKELQEDCETVKDLLEVNPDFVMAALLTFIKYGIYDPK